MGVKQPVERYGVPLRRLVGAWGQMNHSNITDEEQRLIEKIRHAFAGVTLDDGTSLNMTEYNDSGGCRPDFKEKAKDYEREDWTAIPDDTLEQFTVTFSFTDLKGFRLYIPAYMVWTIKNHKSSDSIIADFTICAIRPHHYLFESVPFWTWFTNEQAGAMIQFPEYAARNDDALYGIVARENLEKIKKTQPAPPPYSSLAAGSETGAP